MGLSGGTPFFCTSSFICFLLFLIPQHLLTQLFQIELMVRLHVVEAHTVYTNHSRLRNKGVRIDFVNQLEDEVRLALFGYAEYHLYVLLGIEAVAVEHRAATVGYLVYRLAYLLILVGDDKELNALAQRVDQMVDYKRDDKQQYVAIEHLLPVAQHHIRRGDDGEVA